MPYKVEIIVRKGQIAYYEQFLLFSQCFPQLCIFSVSKCGIVWKWVNGCISELFKMYRSTVLNQTYLLYSITCIKGPLNSLPNDKFIDWSKLKAFADD